MEAITFEMGLVLVLVLVAVVLFATEKLPVDLVALLILCTLLVSGIISPEESVTGFSNTATVTVGAMFVLSEGLFRTGAVNILGSWISAVNRKNPSLGLITLMLTVGLISAVINNTAAVAIFLPVVFAVAKDTGVSVSKLLMPLSFASIFGGACTLIGTSTNILVNSIVVDHGLPAFTMFTFTPFGLVVFAAGILYMLTLGARLTPNHKVGDDLTDEFELTNYLIEFTILPGNKSVGKSLVEAPLIRDHDVAVLEIHRDGRLLHEFPGPSTILETGDRLRVRCRLENIKRLKEQASIVFSGDPHLSLSSLDTNHMAMMEAVLGPDSEFEGKTLQELQFRTRYGAIVVAIRHGGKVRKDRMAAEPLHAGDVLLLTGTRNRLSDFSKNPSFVLVNKVNHTPFRKEKILPALLIVVAVVLGAALNLMSILGMAILGSVAMVLTKCISMEEAYKAVEWRVIFLLAGVLTLGIAMENTGSAHLLSQLLVDGLGSFGPRAVLSALFFLSFSLTNVMSNNATAALLAPIAIGAAQAMGISYMPFVMAITYAASLSFMTPVGYQTNTMIYSVGHYRFSDFMRVGTPLTPLFWIMATILIPVFWPF